MNKLKYPILLVVSFAVYFGFVILDSESGWLNYFKFYMICIVYPILCVLNSINVSKSKNIFYILRKKHSLSYLITGIFQTTVYSLIISLPLWLCPCNYEKIISIVFEVLAFHLVFILIFYGIAYLIEVKQAIAVLNFIVFLINIYIIGVTGGGWLAVYANIGLDLVIMVFAFLLFLLDRYLFRSEKNYDKIFS